MTVVIITAGLFFAISTTLFLISKSKLETRISEKDLIINSLRQHVSNLEEVSAKSVLQADEIKKLKSEIQSLKDKMKAGTVSTSGISISGISTSAIESEPKKRSNRKK